MKFDFTKITAKQIMSQDVLTVHQDTSVKDALATLDEHRTTCAPVLNALEEFLGEFSGIEAVRRIEAVAAAEVPWGLGGAPSALENIDDPEAEDPAFAPDPDSTDAAHTEEPVEHWMSTEPRWVSPETTVEEVCRRMVREGLQRVLVLEGKRLRGIISALDVVLLVAGLKSAEAHRNDR